MNDTEHLAQALDRINQLERENAKLKRELGAKAFFTELKKLEAEHARVLALLQRIRDERDEYKNLKDVPTPPAPEQAEYEALKASSIELAHRYAGLKAEHEALEARCDHLEKERARLLETCELNNSTIEIYKRMLGERE